MEILEQLKNQNQANGRLQFEKMHGPCREYEYHEDTISLYHRLINLIDVG
jgi:hypothetical protein